MKLERIRSEYKYAELNERDVNPNPVNQFAAWLAQALEAGVNEATAMALATIGADGFPQSRIVLLKDFDEHGFTFYTNYKSDKGQAIANRPAVGLHFFWPELERQVRISGTAEKIDAEESDRYFLSRPERSRIAAIVSDQSRVIPSRRYLEERFDQMKQAAENQSLTRPVHWGGYRVKPLRIEFWQGRESRLHDRILYERNHTNWNISRLAP